VLKIIVLDIDEGLRYMAGVELDRSLSHSRDTETVQGEHNSRIVVLEEKRTNNA